MSKDREKIRLFQKPRIHSYRVSKHDLWEEIPNLSAVINSRNNLKVIEKGNGVTIQSHDGLDLLAAENTENGLCQIIWCSKVNANEFLGTVGEIFHQGDKLTSLHDQPEDIVCFGTEEATFIYDPFNYQLSAVLRNYEAKTIRRVTELILKTQNKLDKQVVNSSLKALINRS